MTVIGPRTAAMLIDDPEYLRVVEHEAAHVVAALCYGLRVDSCTVFPPREDGGDGGETWHEPSGDAWRDAVVGMAGTAATGRYPGDGHDLEAAAELVGADRLRDAENEARWIIRAHRALFAEIVEALLEHDGTLEWDRIAEIAEPHFPGGDGAIGCWHDHDDTPRRRGARALD